LAAPRTARTLPCWAPAKAPTPVFLACAIDAAVSTASLSIDPARPLQTLVLRGFLAPAKADQLLRSERNILLYDGISTYTIDRDGTTRIERQITTYQTNSASLPDASYLDINTPRNAGADPHRAAAVDCPEVPAPQAG
jgi:phage tail sheath gpL-like